MADNGIDISWPLDEQVEIKVTRYAGDIYDIEDTESGMKLRLSWNHNTGTGRARLLFNGKDIETEEYMAYVGLMDEVTELLGEAGVGTVIISKGA